MQECEGEVYQMYRDAVDEEKGLGEVSVQRRINDWSF